VPELLTLLRWNDAGTLNRPSFTWDCRSGPPVRISRSRAASKRRREGRKHRGLRLLETDLLPVQLTIWPVTTAVAIAWRRSSASILGVDARLPLIGDVPRGLPGSTKAQVSAGARRSGRAPLNARDTSHARCPTRGRPLTPLERQPCRRRGSDRLGLAGPLFVSARALFGLCAVRCMRRSDDEREPCVAAGLDLPSCYCRDSLHRLGLMHGAAAAGRTLGVLPASGDELKPRRSRR